MTKKKATTQRMEFIPLDSIEPSDYQRSTNPTQVENITKGFDEARLGTLTVSLRGGKYYIIDGAHRLSALRNLKFTHTLCEVLTGLTYEQEAEYFRRQNQDKRALKPYDLFKAGLIAGDEICIRINEIVKANSFQIGLSHKNFYQIGALHALFTIVQEFGYETLDDTLCLIANTWAGIARATCGEVLLGVSEFVHRYGVREFDKRLGDSFSVIWYEYREVTRIAYQSAMARKNYCRVLVEHYNKGLASKSRKRIKWED
jgi:hypothetical protein